MKPVKLRGSLPASLCPFKPDFSIDEDAFAAHVRWLAAASKGGGIVCNGHAGEVASLTRKERKRVIEIAVKEAKGRAPVVAGVYTDSTPEAIELARDAEAAGASAILLFPSARFGWRRKSNGNHGIELCQIGGGVHWHRGGDFSIPHRRPGLSNRDPSSSYRDSQRCRGERGKRPPADV